MEKKEDFCVIHYISRYELIRSVKFHIDPCHVKVNTVVSWSHRHSHPFRHKLDESLPYVEYIITQERLIFLILH